MTEKDDIEYGFFTGFFGDGYATQKSYSDEDDKWDHEWDFERTSQHAREAAWPGETFEGFASNCGDVVTIHIKESSSIPIDSIKNGSDWIRNTVWKLYWWKSSMTGNDMPDIRWQT